MFILDECILPILLLLAIVYAQLVRLVFCVFDDSLPIHQLVFSFTNWSHNNSIAVLLLKPDHHRILQYQFL